MKLFKAILLLMLVASLVPTLMVGLLSLADARKILVRDAQELAQERVKQLRLRTEGVLHEPARAVMGLSRVPGFFRLPLAEQRGHIAAILSQSREVLAVTLFSPSGERLPGLQAYAVEEVSPSELAQHEQRAQSARRGDLGRALLRRRPRAAPGRADGDGRVPGRRPGARDRRRRALARPPRLGARPGPDRRRWGRLRGRRRGPDRRRDLGARRGHRRRRRRAASGLAPARARPRLSRRRSLPGRQLRRGRRAHRLGLLGDRRDRLGGRLGAADRPRLSASPVDAAAPALRGAGGARGRGRARRRCSRGTSPARSRASSPGRSSWRAASSASRSRSRRRTSSASSPRRSTT